MPYYDTAQQWLTQSTLLLQARPTTTRITTKYTIAHPIDSSKPAKSKPRKPKPSTSTSTATDSSTTAPPSTNPAPPRDPVRATLTLKTYDPDSGVTLKYRTTKAAEVGRLIQSAGRLARPMAGLPEVKDAPVMVEAGPGVVTESGSGVATPVTEVVASTAKPGGGGGQGGGGHGGKKGKKGRK